MICPARLKAVTSGAKEYRTRRIRIFLIYNELRFCDAKAVAFSPVRVYTIIYTLECAMTGIAKIFKNGASQAVRLPRDFRFEAEEVCIKRIGSAVLLFPRGAAWDLMDEALGQVDDDFMAKRDQPERPDERQAL